MSIHWTLSYGAANQRSELLKVIEGHSVLLRPAGAEQLRGWPEADLALLCDVPTLPRVTSGAKKGQSDRQQILIN